MHFGPNKDDAGSSSARDTKINLQTSIYNQCNTNLVFNN